jgi:guanosine-3',5'-bis(diphosphate) 3'-pyrophosphohydrolase
MDQLTAAKHFATLHHVIRKGQLYGPVPYTHHLSDVEGVLREFGITDEDMLVASWLHDVIEDTDVKVRDIEESFGSCVATLVSAVTSEDGPNRKTRNALTYPKIRGTGNAATKLKLADRIANVRNGGSSVEMYRREHSDFKHALTTGLEDEESLEMWAELDRLLGFKRADSIA